MDETEYLRLRRQIEEEYSRNLEALDRVWEIARRLQPAAAPWAGNAAADPKPIPSIQREHRIRAGRGDIAVAVLGILEKMHGQFTWREVRSQLMFENPGIIANRTTISQILKRTCESGQVVLARAGRGKRAAIYTKPSVDLANSTGHCTPEQADRIRGLIRSKEIDVTDFRRDYMDPVGAQKLLELSSQQADEIISELASIEPQVANAPDDE